MAFYGSFVIDVTDVTNDSYVINDNNVNNVIPVSNVNY